MAAPRMATWRERSAMRSWARMVSTSGELAGGAAGGLGAALGVLGRREVAARALELGQERAVVGLDRPDLVGGETVLHLGHLGVGAGLEIADLGAQRGDAEGRPEGMGEEAVRVAGVDGGVADGREGLRRAGHHGDGGDQGEDGERRQAEARPSGSEHEGPQDQGAGKGRGPAAPVSAGVERGSRVRRDG